MGSLTKARTNTRLQQSFFERHQDARERLELRKMKEVVEEITKLKYDLCNGGSNNNGHLKDERMPSAFVTYLLSCPFSKKERQFLQVERAAHYFLQTHPDFNKCFNNASHTNYIGRKVNVPTVTFVDQLQEFDESDRYFHFFETYFPQNFRLSARKTVHKVNAQLLARYYWNRGLNKSASEYELNQFFWTLVELTLLYECSNTDKSNSVFLSLHFDENHWCQDVDLMLTYLSTVDLTSLEHRISDKMMPKDSYQHYYQHQYQYWVMDETTAKNAVEKMFLRVPNQRLIDKLGDRLPWEFLIRYGSNEWKAKHLEFFTKKVRQATDLITALSTLTSTYLCGEPVVTAVVKLESANFREIKRAQRKLFKDKHKLEQSMSKFEPFRKPTAASYKKTAAFTWWAKEELKAIAHSQPSGLLQRLQLKSVEPHKPTNNHLEPIIILNNWNYSNYSSDRDKFFPRSQNLQKSKQFRQSYPSRKYDRNRGQFGGR